MSATEKQPPSLHTKKPGRWRRAARRALGFVARPVRRAQGRGGVVVETYRGYGSSDEVFLIGRVFRQSRRGVEGDDESLRGQLRDIRRRITRRAVAGAELTARFGACTERVTTDRDGYFRVHLQPKLQPVLQAGWHAMDLDLEGAEPVRARGEIFIPSQDCRRVIISDIDDTIMRTGVANKFKMLWRLFVEDAEGRVAFPGAASLYRALHAGPGGGEANPMLYVSRAPWGIYDMLSAFFALHRIPVGPVLFLREWGLSWKSPLPRRAEDHKREVISRMLALYRDLPFVLIGDSGQHDPEVYRQIVAEHPGRVVAVYIRNVSRDAGRIEEIEALAHHVAAAGSSLVLAADSLAMAEHAAELGLIGPEALEAVAAEKDGQGALTEAHAGRARRRLGRATPRALKDLLGGRSGEAPPSLVVEPDDRADPAGGTTRSHEAHAHSR